MSSVKALVVGTGFGCRIQIPALRAAGFDVVGLVGNDPERTSARAASSQVATAFTDLDEAIMVTGAKVVAISTPPTTHHALTLKAIAYGCHVLCEKPFAATAQEAREMLTAAEKAGVVHMIGHEFRFIPQQALFARSVAAGRIGDPRLFAMVQFNSYVADYADSLPEWWFDPGAAGGWLGASGSHVIDQIRTSLGEVASVSATLPQVALSGAGVEDSFVVHMALENGGEGSVQQTGGSIGPMSNVFRVAGTEGSIWMEGCEVLLATREGVGALPMQNDLALPHANPGTDPRQQGAEWQRLTAVELPPYTSLCLCLRAAIEGQAAPTAVAPATFADGLACMKILEAVRASAASGGARVTIA